MPTDRRASIWLQLLAAVNFPGADYKVYLEINSKLEARLLYCGEMNVPIRISQGLVKGRQALVTGRQAPKSHLLLFEATALLFGEQENVGVDGSHLFSQNPAAQSQKSWRRISPQRLSMVRGFQGSDSVERATAESRGPPLPSHGCKPHILLGLHLQSRTVSAPSKGRVLEMTVPVFTQHSTLDPC